jgi:hypothetical protein
VLIGLDLLYEELSDESIGDPYDDQDNESSLD